MLVRFSLVMFIYRLSRTVTVVVFVLSFVNSDEFILTNESMKERKKEIFTI